MSVTTGSPVPAGPGKPVLAQPRTPSLGTDSTIGRELNMPRPSLRGRLMWVAALFALAVAPNAPARFIFATEDGTIRGWNPGVPPQPPLTTSHETEIVVDNSRAGSVFKGIAIGSVGTSNFLYANDFVNGKIDVFDGSFK